MNKKIPLWNRYSTWQEAEKVWDEGAKNVALEQPIKKVAVMPSIPGMTDDTAKNLKWKSLKWMILKDEGWQVTRFVLKRPFTHFFRFVKSLLSKKSFVRSGDFYYYGIQSEDDFKKLLEKENCLLVVGFSYCEKPFECPSGRFTDECIHDAEHPVCRQCFIGKAMNTLPKENTISLFIPTIHYVGRKMFEVIAANPDRSITFLITACEMTLEMFGDYGNMAGVKGIGVRLDGRICNTMKAFELSERGIKPGLTCVLPETKQRIFDLLSFWRKQK